LGYSNLIKRRWKINKITFGIIDDYLFYDKSIHPVHISEQIPEWYKSVPNNLYRKVSHFKYLNNLKTIRSCSSFVNVFKNGYVILAPTDILLIYNSESKTYNWEVPYVWKIMFPDRELIESHSGKQMLDYTPINKEKIILKLNLPYTIFTNNGYSCIQMEVPYSYNEDWKIPYGILDTDKIHELNLQLIITTEDKEILIKKGTPLALYIPFKREKHIMNVVNINTNKKFFKRFKKYTVGLFGSFKYSVNKLKGTQ